MGLSDQPDRLTTSARHPASTARRRPGSPPGTGDRLACQARGTPHCDGGPTSLAYRRMISTFHRRLYYHSQFLTVTLGERVLGSLGNCTFLTCGNAFWPGTLASTRGCIDEQLRTRPCSSLRHRPRHRQAAPAPCGSTSWLEPPSPLPSGTRAGRLCREPGHPARPSPVDVCSPLDVRSPLRHQLAGQPDHHRHQVRQQRQVHGDHQRRDAAVGQPGRQPLPSRAHLLRPAHRPTLAVGCAAVVVLNEDFGSLGRTQQAA